MSEKTNEKDVISSRDIYEIAYFLTKTACKIESIDVTEELGKPACLVVISGDNLKKHQLDYLNSETNVEAVHYRKSLTYVRSLVYGHMNKTKRQEGGKA